MPQQQFRHATPSPAVMATQSPAPQAFGSNEEQLLALARAKGYGRASGLVGGYQNAGLNLDGTRRYGRAPAEALGGYQNASLNLDGTPRYGRSPAVGGYQNASLNLDGTPRYGRSPAVGGYQNASLNLDGSAALVGGYQNASLNLDGSAGLLGGYQNASLNLDGSSRYGRSPTLRASELLFPRDRQPGVK